MYRQGIKQKEVGTRMNRRTLLTTLTAGISVSSGCLSQGSSEPVHVVEVQNRTEQVKNVGVVITDEEGEVLFNRSYRIGPEAMETNRFAGEPDRVLVRYGKESQREFDFRPPEDCSRNRTGAVSIYVGGSGISTSFTCR